MRELDPVQVNLAQDVAQLFLAQTQAAGVPSAVKFMSLEIVIRALLDTNVKAEKRLQFFDAWMLAIRDEITGKGEKNRAKGKGRDRRSNRSTHPRKAPREGT